MTAHWKTRALGEVCRIVGGGTPSKRRADFYSGAIPWATVRDMRQEILSDTEFKITRAAVDASSTHIIPAGNVVIATRVGLGKVCLLAQDTAINQDLRAIIPHDPRQLAVRFLFWWLKSVAGDIISEGTGATVQGVKLPFVKALQIPLPPLSEQQRIVELLDTAIEGIGAAMASADRNLGNARNLFDGHLARVFSTRGTGWEDATIGDVVHFIDYRGKTPRKTTSGLRLITAKNVKMGYLQNTPMEYVAPSSYESWMTRGIPQRGDILFTTEAPLANVAQLDTADRVVFAQRIIIMQPERNRLDSTFLKYMLLSQPLQERIRTKGTGATVQGIKASLLRTIEISFPRALEEQRRLAATLDTMRKETQRLAGVYSRKCELLAGLKMSIMHHVFAGRL